MSITSVGIAFAFVAMLCWGFGDFWIQRSTRKAGDWETLFIITFFGAIILAPFALGDFIDILFLNQSKELLILVGASLILLVASLLEFESLKIGKIAVVEPIWSVEIIASATLAFIILGERLDFTQLVTISLLILGLILVSVKERGKLRLKNFFLERGVFLAFFAAVVMGSTNFMYGISSRVFDPILTNLFVNIIVAAITFTFLLVKGRIGKMISDFKNNLPLMVSMSIADNVAWVAFAFAMSMAPIGIVVALSESYIIITVILGFFINKEKLQTHQKVGLFLALIGAITLAVTTS